MEALLPMFKLSMKDHAESLVGIAFRVLVLMLPTGLLIGACLRADPSRQMMFWMGTAFQAVVCMLSFMSRRSWYTSIGPSVITLYLIALCWLWWGQPENDWYTNLSKGILLVIPLLVFA